MNDISENEALPVDKAVDEALEYMPADDGDNSKNRVAGGTLYLVGTPIGNLSDISPRALKVLTECAFIAAEDTRVTAKLCARYGIRRPMIQYHEHNKRDAGKKIAERLAAGESCALVTDAGMPGISDPGADMVKLCCERGLPVTCVPGPCAALTALVLSGLPTDRFVFEGFLTSDSAAKRRRRIDELASETRTLILYEAPHRLAATLKQLFEGFGDRRIALCRELTKLNEEILRTTLSEAVIRFGENTPRGEFVLIIEGCPEKPNELTSLPIAEHVRRYMDNGMTKNDAMKAAARDRGVSKSVIYRELLDSGEKQTENNPKL